MNKACNKTASVLLQNRPDVIILTTPHGLSLSTSLAIYESDVAVGSAKWLNYWQEYYLEAPCDIEVAQELLAFIKANNTKIAVEGITGPVPAPLAWGEVVPLWFLRESFAEGTKVVILSWPQRRHDPLNYADEATDIGRALFNFTSAHKSKIGIVFSCDMSHMHGTVPGTRDIFSGAQYFGSESELAAAFDASVVKWIKAVIDGDLRKSRQILREECSTMVVAAKVCGWTGFCALQGCMEEVQRQTVESIVESMEAKIEEVITIADRVTFVYTSSTKDSPSSAFEHQQLLLQQQHQRQLQPDPRESDLGFSKVVLDIATMRGSEESCECPQQVVAPGISSQWSGQVHGYSAPTYFGMMAASIRIYGDSTASPS